jgi:hypothetical protein
MMQKRTTPLTANKILFVDVMKDDRFVFTLRYEYCPLFKIDMNDIYEKIIEKHPTLRNKRIELYID